MASSWLNQSRDDRKSKTRPRKQTSNHQKNQSGRSKRSLHESQEEPRGERDVIRLRNPTEDKRAFRRMLTSADLNGSEVAGYNIYDGAIFTEKPLIPTQCTWFSCPRWRLLWAAAFLLLDFFKDLCSVNSNKTHSTSRKFCYLTLQEDLCTRILH